MMVTTQRGTAMAGDRVMREKLATLEALFARGIRCRSELGAIPAAGRRFPFQPSRAGGSACLGEHVGDVPFPPIVWRASLRLVLAVSESCHTFGAGWGRATVPPAPVAIAGRQPAALRGAQPCFPEVVSPAAAPDRHGCIRQVARDARRQVRGIPLVGSRILRKRRCPGALAPHGCAARTGRPSARHSGRPPSRRRALKPCLRRAATAWWA